MHGRRPGRRKPGHIAPIMGAAPPEGGSTHLGPWTIVTKKGPILTNEEIEEWTSLLKAPCLPEMVHGGNYVAFKHNESGFELRFDTKEALKAWEIHGPTVKVAYSKKWKHERRDVEKEVDLKEADEFDWTFTTKYQGTIYPEQKEKAPSVGHTFISEEEIDYAKLRIPEAINFFDEVVLFEDELADNGESMLTVKVRVMPASFYCLMRFWMRVDDVLFRIYDTRIHHEVGKPYLLREYQTREATYKKLQEENKFPKDPTKLNSADAICPLLDEITKKTHKILVV